MNKIIKGSYLFLILGVLLFLGGCKTTHNPVPEGYQGGLAQLDDTYVKKSRRSADFFYVSKVNGKSIDNAVAATNRASAGKGMAMYAQGVSRKVPAQKMTLSLVGQVHHSAPIGYMFNSGENYILKGDIEFTPEADQMYFIRGTLSASFSAVWLSDIDGNQVSDAVVLDATSSKEETRIVALSEGPLSLPEPPKYIAPPVPASAVTQTKASDTETLPNNPLFKVEQGMSEDALVKHLGEPDHVKVIPANFFTSRPKRKEFHYQDIGTVVLTRGADAKMYASTTYMVANNERGRLAQAIVAAGSSKTREIGQRYFNIGLYDSEALDAMAEKIWQHQNTADPHMLDGISWYCKVIGKSENVRYRDVLSTLVADKSLPSKLRRHCSSPAKSLGKLAQGDEDQFKPTII